LTCSNEQIERVQDYGPGVAEASKQIEQRPAAFVAGHNFTVDHGVVWYSGDTLHNSVKRRVKSY
jgi:hypothetical protein